MLQRISTQHALCSVLAPPIIPTTKPKERIKKQKKEGKESFFLNLKMKNTLQRTSGLHQSISLKGAWELASSQWSSRIMMGAQREYRKEEGREGEREREREKERKREKEKRNYLNLTTFHQCAVEFFPGFLCICAGLKCHKAKTLWYTAEVKEVDSWWGTHHKGLRGGREENP